MYGQPARADRTPSLVLWRAEIEFLPDDPYSARRKVDELLFWEHYSHRAVCRRSAGFHMFYLQALRRSVMLRGHGASNFVTVKRTALAFLRIRTIKPSRRWFAGDQLQLSLGIGLLPIHAPCQGQAARLSAGGNVRSWFPVSRLHRNSMDIHSEQMYIISTGV